MGEEFPVNQGNYLKASSYILNKSSCWTQWFACSVTEAVGTSSEMWKGSLSCVSDPELFSSQSHSC